MRISFHLPTIWYSLAVTSDVCRANTVVVTVRDGGPRIAHRIYDEKLMMQAQLDYQDAFPHRSIGLAPSRWPQRGYCRSLPVPSQP